MQQGDPIEGRYKEYMERGSIIEQFIYCINSYREAAKSKDPKFDHIDISEKQKVNDFSIFLSRFFEWLLANKFEIDFFLMLVGHK